MEPGIVWGGVIQNENGEPIPGVKVNMYYFEKGSSANPHLRVNIRDVEVSTDKDGRWRMDILPADFDEEPWIYLTHPDYVSDHLQWAIFPRPITKRPSYEVLCAQTSVMVMRKGATVEGRVIDEAGKPIPRASVCNQEECSEEDAFKSVATTDASGHFMLSGLNNFSKTRDTPTGYGDGHKNFRIAPDNFKTEAVLTVQATGYAPELITTSYSQSASPLEISLKPGKDVQGKVVNEEGEPIEGVSIRLGYWKGHLGRFNRKTTTDAAGRFRLIDAPLESAVYSVEKDGYASMIQELPISAESDKDNVVTMKSTHSRAKSKKANSSNTSPAAETKTGAGVSANGGQLFELTVLGPDKKPMRRASVCISNAWGKLQRGTVVEKRDHEERSVCTLVSDGLQRRAHLRL